MIGLNGFKKQASIVCPRSNLKTIELKFQDDSGQMEEEFTFRWAGAGWVWQFGKITTPDIYSFLALFIDEQINEGGFKGD